MDGSRPLPSYTSIDLESELADIFATNLNPHIKDAGMSGFYSNRMEKSARGVSMHPPPPIYPLPEEHPAGREHPFPFSSRTGLILLGLIFFALPLLILFLFLLLSSPFQIPNPIHPSFSPLLSSHSHSEPH
ncbi:hypothetical protein PMAYCL1PPCAC_00916 [Pristionchus mayeri]|uniref:Uncharacterized protein n=1 Tax=Pristionchus mayeri TaxID=1317129 RepID=A0AAN4YYL8_9BILA|nr:hypothetical protein PMAYCL1PPCAC_00916 [Pristionchus mayeri]